MTMMAFKTPRKNSIMVIPNKLNNSSVVISFKQMKETVENVKKTMITKKREIVNSSPTVKLISKPKLKPSFKIMVKKEYFTQKKLPSNLKDNSHLFWSVKDATSNLIVP